MQNLFYDFKKISCTWDISAQTKIAMGYLFMIQDYHSYAMDMMVLFGPGT